MCKELLCLLALAGSLGVASYPALRTQTPPTIDGDLSDPAWAAAPEIDGFTQRDPDEGKPASQRTVVKVVYDDRAIYFGAHLYDDGPVTVRLARRDTTPESDWFRIYLDPRLDGRTGATFQVNPANVQYDAVLHSDSIADPDWDAVWESAARVVVDGWVAEIAIPLSQLRFPDAPTLIWGINLSRTISRRNELSRLVHTPKNDAGFVSRFARLTGLEGIRPRRSLELLPYAAARLDRENGASRRQGLAGLDLKSALTRNVTLTATLDPDFGQVEVDPARVNLTQYELFFPEKRPFFVEGASLFEPEVIANHIFDFNFTSPILFYSRRIGRPSRAAGLLGAVDAPEQTTILAAAKVTGKTAGGLTLAALDAVTDEEQASINGVRESLEPRTNYWVSRVGKDLGSRSAVGFRTTAVNRSLTPVLSPLLPHAAYTVSADGYRTFRDNTYVLQWTAATSRLEGSPEAVLLAQRSSARTFQRLDAGHVELDPGKTSLSGSGGSVLFAKHAGRWQYNLQTAAYSPGFDTNEVGFMPRSDIVTTHAVLLFSDPSRWRWARSRSAWIAKFQHWNWDGDLVQNGLVAEAGTLLQSYRRLSAWGGSELRTVDDRGTRGGFAILRPEQRWLGAGVGTDTRKNVVVDLSGEVLRDELHGWNDVLSLGVTLRPSTRLSLRFTPSYRTSRFPLQYVETVGDRAVFATLDQRILELAARLDWTFTSRLSLQLYLQPYVVAGDYGGFKEARARSLDFPVYGVDAGTITYDGSADAYTIDPDGPGTASPFTLGDPDFDYRSLRANAVLRWEFRPGSALFAVWNDSREDVLPDGELHARRDVGEVFSAPSHGVFLLKASWWFGR